MTFMTQEKIMRERDRQFNFVKDVYKSCDKGGHLLRGQVNKAMEKTGLPKQEFSFIQRRHSRKPSQ